MLNKKVLSKIDLGSYKKPNPYSKDIIYDPKGQWKYPGQNTRIPGGDITMQGVPYPVYAQPNIGQPQMMYPDQNYQFPGADYVDEFPQMKKGGRIKGLVSMPKPSKKGLMSNKYSRSLDATNKLFTENFLFAKPKSRKNKVFDPNAKYYAKGGALLTKEVTCKKCGWEWDAADGGKDITTCHECGGQGLVHAQDGGTYTVKGSKGVYKKVNGKWQVDWNKSGNYQPLSKGDVKARTAVLDKMAKPVYTPSPKIDPYAKIKSNSSDNTNLNLYKKEIPWDLSKKYQGDILAQNKKNNEDAINYRAKNTISNEDFDKKNHISTEFPKKATTSDYAQRVWEYATNPGTALEYAFGKKSGQGPMPFNINQLKEQGVNVNSDNNLVGNMFNMINPLDDVESVRSGVSDITEGNNSGYLNAGLGLLSFIPGFGEAKKATQAVNTAANTVDAARDINKAIEFTGPLKHTYQDVPEALNALRQRGSYWDKAGATGKDLLHSDMINYHGTYSGRPLVEVKMPDGSSEMFYKSSGWAGKQGNAANGTTEGMWQVFGGHADTPQTSNWFIKDKDYQNYYGSKTFGNMAENMDNALIQKLGFNSVDELDNAFNFQNRFGNVDSFTPNKKKGGTTNDYIELDLTPEEVQRYKEGGYVVEDISIPSLNQMQDGGENENLPNKVQDLNEVTVYGNQEKIKLQGSLIDRLKQVKKAYNDHRVNLGLEKQKQSAEGTSSIISLKDQIQSYKKELNEEKKSYDKASKALNVLKKYNPESYKKAKVSDVLNTTGVDDLRNLYKEGKISDATFMDFYDNFGKSYDREVTRTTEEDQVKLEDSWYGKPDEKGRTRWMGNPNNVSKVAQTVAIGAPLAAAAPMMAPAVVSTLANPYVAGGLNAYFAGHGINEFNDPNSLTRKSMSRAYDDPTASNIGDAAFDVGVNSLNFVGLPFGKAIKGANPKNIAKRILEIPSENMTARLSPEDLKIYRQVQDIARLRAKNVPYSKQLITAMEYNIPEEHLLNIFGKSKSEIEELIPFMKEQEAFRLANPASERINLVRPARSGTSRGAYGEYTSGERVATPTVLDDVVDVDAQENSLEIIANNLNDNVLSDILRSRPDRNSIVRNAVESNITSIAGVEEYISNYIINNPIPPAQLFDPLSIRRGRTLIGQETPRQSLYDAFKEDVSDVANAFNSKGNALNKKVKKNLEKFISNYPVHEGVVLENVPTLNLRGSGSLKKVSDKVASNSTANIKSGDVFTGSLNTSHNSYLPQLKQVFKYKDGAPQFLGYKPMNSAGFLSEYHYSPEQINKYLNTEIDDLIKKGIVPNNIERPFLKNESIILPHYGIKQYKQGGTTNDYVDAELTPEEIKDLIAQGYVIEELN